MGTAIPYALTAIAAPMERYSQERCHNKGRNPDKYIKQWVGLLKGLSKTMSIEDQTVNGN